MGTPLPFVLSVSRSGRAISYVRGCSRPGAVGAAEKATANLHAMTNHSAPAMLTDWRNRLNRALEAIECVPCTGSDQFESLIVLVATNLAFRHTTPRLVRCTVSGILLSWAEATD